MYIWLKPKHLLKWGQNWAANGAYRPYRRRVFSEAMKAGLTVQRATCTCMGAGLAARRMLCTCSQLAWTCKASFAWSSFRETQSIDILVPKIRHHAPHPSDDQNIAKTMLFQRQKRRFLDGVRFSEFLEPFEIPRLRMRRRSLCCDGRKRARPAARGSAAGERARRKSPRHMPQASGIIFIQE